MHHYVGVGVMLSLTGKSDQPVVYASRLPNTIEYNYNTIEIKVLAMGFTLYKFKHYLLNNKFFFM
jgi:hypothetical protein